MLCLLVRRLLTLYLFYRRQELVAVLSCSGGHRLGHLGLPHISRACLLHNLHFQIFFPLLGLHLPLNKLLNSLGVHLAVIHLECLGYSLAGLLYSWLESAPDLLNFLLLAREVLDAWVERMLIMKWGLTLVFLLLPIVHSDVDIVFAHRPAGVQLRFVAELVVLSLLDVVMVLLLPLFLFLHGLVSFVQLHPSGLGVSFVTQ